MFRENQQIGNYTLIKQIGRGGFGEVWLAENRTTLLTKKVAIKLPLDSNIDLETVRREAALWEQASGHSNVLPIIEANIYNGQVAIISEYAPDGSLDDLLKYHGKLPPEKAVELALGILSGLDFLHSRRIIHRDLKPANILLQGETPRLTDFGISHLLRTTSASKSDHIKGTFAYMSPEAFDGVRSEQTDIWAFGVILYEMLSGKLPFPQPDLGTLFGAIYKGKIEPLPDDVSFKLKEIVAKCLTISLEQRYRTAKEVRTELERELVRLKHPTNAPTDFLNKDKLKAIYDTNLKINPLDKQTIDDIIPPTDVVKTVPPTARQQFVTTPNKNLFWKNFLTVIFTILGMGVLIGSLIGLVRLIEYANSKKSKAITELTYIPYRKGDRWGIVDKNKKIIIEPQYDFIRVANEGMLVARRDKKLILFDENVKEVASTNYDNINDFNNGLAMAGLNSKYGVIDKTGKVVVPLIYNWVGDFKEDLAQAQLNLNEKYGVIDKTGKVVVPLKYDIVYQFNEGFGTVKLNNKWGFVDKTGKEVIPPKYDDANQFHNGLAKVKLNNRYFYIDGTDKEVISPKYDEVFNFSDGLAKVKSNDKYGFIDTTGKEVIAVKYDYTDDFSEGLVGVRLNDKWGFIDKTGATIITPQYESVEMFYENLAAVKLNDKYGFIDKTGKIIIFPKYSRTSGDLRKLHFENGLALFPVGYIGRDGTEYFEGPQASNSNTNQNANSVNSNNNTIWDDIFKDYGKNSNSNNSNTTTPHSAESYLREGLKYHEKKDYDQAISLYSKCIEADAKKYMCYNNRGVAYRDKGDYDKAIVDATKVIELVPNDWSYYLARGKAYSGNKDYQKAVADFNQSIKLNPNNANTYVERGQANYAWTGKSSPTVSDYCTALKLDRFNETARRSLAEFPGAKCP